jgi:thiamine biosynthesis lipoprotein
MSSVLLEFGRDAMACRFEILLHPGRPAHGPEAALKALDTISYLEQVLSVYLPTSEFSLLNSKAIETPIQVSYACYELIKLGIAVYEQTQGAFDLTAATLSKIWGFHRRQGKMPTDEEIQDSLTRIGSKWIHLDESKRTIHFSKPIEINSGGIGKGFAIDCAVADLKSADIHDFAVHGGKSSLYCSGDQRSPDCEQGWKIAVRHPEQSERILGSLILKDKGLGTSGPANQFFYFRAKRYGHIIDPRTGWPADGMLSITVLHESAAYADALATGLYVMGMDATIDFCNRHPEIGVLAILPTRLQGQCEIVTCNIPTDCWLRAE